MQLSKCPVKVQKFIQFVEDECKKYNIKVIFKNKEYLKDGQWYGAGRFDSTDKEILIATKKWSVDQWLEVFVHEFCHFQQWKRNTKIWRNAFPDKFTDWLYHEIELSDKSLNKYFKKIRNLELDCELRSIKMIKKYKLPISLDHYRNNSNWHMYLYSMMKEHRSFPTIPKRQCNKMWSLIPCRKMLTKKEYDNVPQKCKDLISKHYFGK